MKRLLLAICPFFLFSSVFAMDGSSVEPSNKLKQLRFTEGLSFEEYWTVYDREKPATKYVRAMMFSPEPTWYELSSSSHSFIPPSWVYLGKETQDKLTTLREKAMAASEVREITSDHAMKLCVDIDVSL